MKVSCFKPIISLKCARMNGAKSQCEQPTPNA